MNGSDTERDAMKNTAGKVLTANILNDGVVIYLAAGGTWTESLRDARFLVDASEQKRLLQIAAKDVEQRIVVDPYLMDAQDSAGGPVPVSQRERIRASGPTIPTNFNPSHRES